MPGPLHAPTILLLYPFRFRDPVTRNWVKGELRRRGARAGSALRRGSSWPPSRNMGGRSESRVTVAGSGYKGRYRSSGRRASNSAVGRMSALYVFTGHGHNFPNPLF